MRRWVTVGLLLGAQLFLRSALIAQVADPTLSPLQAGVQSLSMNLSGGGTGSFGYWRMRSEQMNVGWEIGFGGQQNWSTFESVPGAESSRSTTSVSVNIGPRFRRYLETEHRVVPFVQSGVSLGYGYQRSRSDQGTGDDAQRSHSGNLHGSLGLGAEWFPTSRVSVSGFTGLRAGVRYMNGDHVQGRSSAWGLDAGTFTTGLSFRIYLMPGSVLR